MKSQDVISWLLTGRRWHFPASASTSERFQGSSQSSAVHTSGTTVVARYLTDKSIGFEEVAGDLFLSDLDATFSSRALAEWRNLTGRWSSYNLHLETRLDESRASY